MPILFNYLLRCFMIGFFKTVSMIIGLFLLIDGIESIRRFSQKPHFNGPDITMLLLYRIPNFLGMLIPSMVLLSTLMVIAQLTRHNELTVMRASGLSLQRILIPFLMGGMIIAAIHIVLLDQIAPGTNRIVLKLEDYLIDRQVAPATQAGDLWIRNGQQIIHVNHADPVIETLQGVTIFSFDANRRLTAHLEAKTAFRNEGCWQLVDGIEYQFLPELKIHPFQQRAWEITLDPERLTGVTPQPHLLSLTELLAIINQLQQEGHDVTRYQVLFHRKLAAPATTLTAILLAFPFALRLPRSGGTIRSMLLGILLGFAMFVLVDLATALGLGGRLPPILAAWAPVLFFCSIAGFLLLHSATPHNQK
ncbi:MAG: LPS export ABC transporter permease LptG [Magnetococcus sp. YQC-5]